MNDKKIEENKNLKKQTIFIMFVILLSICLILSIYLLGYRLGTIGVSANITKQLDVIKITSNSVDWKESDKLQIFNDTSLNNNRIAPNSNGTYKFIVQNETSENIRYNLSFIEENEKNINMKFRLKIDNIYVIGNENEWIDISEMKVEDVLITSNSKTMYTLEWYWQNGENDTYIGKSEHTEYSLNVNFTPYVER